MFLRVKKKKGSMLALYLLKLRLLIANILCGLYRAAFSKLCWTEQFLYMISKLSMFPHFSPYNSKF